MNSKLLIAIAVVAVVAVGAYFISPKADAPSPSPEETNTTETTDGADQMSAEESATNTEEAASEESQTSSAAPKPQTSAPRPAAQSSAPILPYSATIIYTGTRFIPDDVTIVEGGTVRFVNTSDTEKMWIASNNHPTHTIYPIKTDNDCNGSAFDQCEAVEKNGSWSFTFDRFGGWRFHNHSRAKDGGIVHVLTREEYLKTQ